MKLENFSIQSKLITAFSLISILFGIGIALALKGVFTTSEPFDYFFNTSQVDQARARPGPMQEERDIKIFFSQL